MKRLKLFQLLQRISFVRLVLIFIVVILAPSSSGSEVMQGGAGHEVVAENTASSKVIKGAPGNFAAREEEPRNRDRWDYYLAFFIAFLTSVGVLLLIYFAFHKEPGDPEERRSALYMIVVALIVEGVLIGNVMGIDVKQYEAIYAAIAGYVLGTMGKPSWPSEGGQSQTNAKS